MFSTLLQPKPVEKYIQFEDKAVEAICVANWSSDGIGLTEEDAAKVTTIGTTFRGNKEITSFDEFRYFTGVTSLEKQAFSGCSSLQSVGLQNIIAFGEQAFANCSSLVIEDLNLGGATTMGLAAFYGTKTRKVTGTGSIVTLGSTTTSSGTSGCFQNCTELTDVTLSEGLQNIGKHCFRDTAISSIIIPNSVKVIGGNAFNSCDNLTMADIGSGCESIGASTFEYCKFIEKLICRAATPPSLGAYVFRNTNYTFLIYVPDASLEAYKTATNWNQYSDRIKPLSEIEGSPYIQFEDAEVERVLMANGVSSDGIGITKEDAENVTSISTWFKGNTTIQTFDELQYFTGMTTIPKNAFAGCTNLKSCKISDSVTEIENDAFYSSGIESISAKGVETIGAHSFYSCKSLKSADFPNVKIIYKLSDKYGSFKNCTALQSVNMPYIATIGSTSFIACPIEGKMVLLYLETMGKDVFHYAKITSFLAPKLKIIGNTSFYQCNNLEVMLLRDIESIAGFSNYETFRNCTKLKHFICLAQNVPSLATNVFRGTPINDGTGAIYILDAKVDAYKSAANWSAFANVIKPYSQLATDNPTLYAEIQQYL